MPPPISGEQRIGSYLILRRLGEGGMGVVWLARDEQLDRDVAVKQLTIPGGSSARATQRFIREARSAAKLSHANCLAVHHLIEAEKSLYIVMEYAGGGSLTDRLLAGAIDWREATRMTIAAAEGLHAAHEAGLVHRDVKPSNLLLTVAGTVKVADFGLARAAGLSGEVTVNGAMIGTPAYMAPEQCMGESVDARSDLYSLACTYFSLLTARLPFDDETIASLVYKHTNVALRDASTVNPDVPPAVDEIIARATAKEPRDRYASMADFAAVLNKLLDGDGAFDQTIVLRPATGVRPIVKSPAVSAVRSVTSPTNLPQESSTFIGRERELAEGASLLSTSRLITLVGPGGTGKTRLSVRLARVAAGDFPAGVWWTELAAITTGGETVAAHVAQAVMRSPPPGGKPVTSTLAEFIGDGAMLIVLDNCEHVIDDVARLSDALLAACANVRILATSRQPLSIAGESVMRVPSLDVPETNHSRDVKEIESIDAVRLFMDRAKAASAAFALTPANANHVAEICRRLDGIPLAIELAAARVKVLSPQQIAQRLDDRFKLLVGGSRAALPRQQTLRALVDWSFGLLTDDEKLFFTRVSVFVGSFSLEAAEEVCSEMPIDSALVLDLLGSVVDKSLLLAGTVGDGTSRYRMLETLRQYAADRLRTDESHWKQTARRHAAWATAFAIAADARLEAPDQAAALRELDREFDNIRGALDFLIAEQDAVAATNLMSAMSMYYYRRALLREGVRRAQAVLAIPGGVDSKQRAVLLARACSIARECGEMQIALDLGTEGVRIARALNLPSVLGLAANILGGVYRSIERVAEAREYFEEARDLWRGINEQRSLGRVLNNLALISMDRGEIDDARSSLQEALVIFKREQDRTLIAITQLNLADVEMYDGHWQRALDHIAMVEPITVEMEDHWTRSYCYEAAGRAYFDLGDLPRARELCERSLPILKEVDDIACLATVQVTLAQIAVKEGRLADAAALMEVSLATLLRVDERMELCHGLEWAARLLVEIGSPAVAAAVLGAAAAQRVTLHMPIATAARPRVEETIGRINEVIGEAGYEAGFSGGKEMSLADATRLAIETVRPLAAAGAIAE